MIDRTRMPVLLNRKTHYSAANRAFKQLGFKGKQYHALRKELRERGIVVFDVGRHQHIIERVTE